MQDDRASWYATINPLYILRVLRERFFCGMWCSSSLYPLSELCGKM